MIAIYLLKAANGLYKIGYTSDPFARVRNIQSVSPVPVELILAHTSSRAKEIETELHKKFDKKRARGEWFLLTEDDVEFIKKKYPPCPQVERGTVIRIDEEIYKHLCKNALPFESKGKTLYRLLEKEIEKMKKEKETKK